MYKSLYSLNCLWSLSNRQADDGEQEAAGFYIIDKWSSWIIKVIRV